MIFFHIMNIESMIFSQECHNLELAKFNISIMDNCNHMAMHVYLPSFGNWLLSVQLCQCLEVLFVK